MPQPYFMDLGREDTMMIRKHDLCDGKFHKCEI